MNFPSDRFNLLDHFHSAYEVHRDHVLARQWWVPLRQTLRCCEFLMKQLDHWSCCLQSANISASEGIQRAAPVFVPEKISTFRWMGLRPSPPHFCADFIQALPVGMGVTFIMSGYVESRQRILRNDANIRVREWSIFWRKI
jgi:hypothetical protein